MIMSFVVCYNVWCLIEFGNVGWR